MDKIKEIVSVPNEIGHHFLISCEQNKISIKKHEYIHQLSLISLFLNPTCRTNNCLFFFLSVVESPRKCRKFATKTGFHRDGDICFMRFCVGWGNIPLRLDQVHYRQIEIKFHSSCKKLFVHTIFFMNIIIIFTKKIFISLGNIIQYFLILQK